MGKIFSNDKLLTLAKDYSFVIDNKTITIPAGYKWNGANIPKVFKPLIGGRFCPQNMIPSLVHDYLIDIKWDINERDLKFYSTLLDEGRGKKTAYIMYKLVTLYSLIFFKWKM